MGAGRAAARSGRRARGTSAFPTLRAALIVRETGMEKRELPRNVLQPQGLDQELFGPALPGWGKARRGLASPRSSTVTGELEDTLRVGYWNQ